MCMDGIDTLGCELAAAVLVTFARLRRHGKPQANEHTVLAGFAIVHGRDAGRLSTAGSPARPPVCVALATGTKCLGATQRSASGALLNDSHAEVLPEHCGEHKSEETLQADAKVLDRAEDRHVWATGCCLCLQKQRHALSCACKTGTIKASPGGREMSVNRPCGASLAQVAHASAGCNPSSPQVLARRALQRWLHGELALAASGDAASAYFLRVACGRFRSRGDWRLCMFASQPPCGDACVAGDLHAECAGPRSEGLCAAAEASGPARPGRGAACAAEDACTEAGLARLPGDTAIEPALPQGNAANSTGAELLGPGGALPSAAGSEAGELPGTLTCAMQVALRTGAKPLGPGGALPGAADVEAGELPQAPGAVRRKPGRGALKSRGSTGCLGDTCRVTVQRLEAHK